MFNNPHIPVFFEIEEIEKHLKSLPSKELKLDYLKELYFEFVTLCYNFSDKQLNNYLLSNNLIEKYPPIPYHPSTDMYQTHISSSKFIKYLRKIDMTLLPYVRKEIINLDKSFEEDHSKIIKDYPVFDFNEEKIIEYSNTLKIDRVSYLKWILKKRRDYFDDCPTNHFFSIDLLVNNDGLINEISRLIDTLERYPELIYENKEDSKKTEKDVPELFKNDKTLCGFDLKGIKEIAKNKPNTKDAIFYLMHVKKEALQHEDLIPKVIVQSFFRYLNIEINFYKEKQMMENESISKPSSVAAASVEPQKEPLRLHWQSDDVLLPYLMKQLFDEGFINSSDYELRRDFIEQSFYKKNKAIYSAKEAGTAESNYRLNKNNKPSKSHKVERVIDSLKSKRDELSKKKTPPSKKK